MIVHFASLETRIRPLDNVPYLNTRADDAQVDHNNIYFHSMLNSCGWCYLILMRVISHMSLKTTRFGNASNLSLTEGESSSWTWSIKIQSTTGWLFSHFMSTRRRRGKVPPRVKIIRDKVMKPKLWFTKPFLEKLFDMLDEIGIRHRWCLLMHFTFNGDIKFKRMVMKAYPLHHNLIYISCAFR